MAQIDVLAFRERESQGLITCRSHPTHDLLIWNYTPKCQFERAWDEVTMQARGLITTGEGKIVGRPFRKFMNYAEHRGAIPLEPFKVTEKMDGSLLIVTSYQGEQIIATRGSFTSEQADRGRAIIQKRYADFDFRPYYTYLFECIYPGNRIVCDYGSMEDIVLLAVIHTETGQEHDIHDPIWVEMWPFPIVKHYDGIQDIAQLQKWQEANKEGFVIRFESGLRLKIKMEEYVRLHRLLTQVNARVIWEILREGQALDELLEKVPDEFFAWVKSTQQSLQEQYSMIEQAGQALYEQVKDLPTRKEQAAIACKSPYSDIVFRLLDGKPYAEQIWKRIKPMAERPFREDEG
jgi:RNA ligase